MVKMTRKNQPNQRVVAYCRGTTIRDLQRHMGRAKFYAKQHGMKIEKIYTDVKSNDKLRNFDKLVDFIERNGIEVVLFDKFDDVLIKQYYEKIVLLAENKGLVIGTFNEEEPCQN